MLATPGLGVLDGVLDVCVDVFVKGNACFIRLGSLSIKKRKYVPVYLGC